MQPGQFPAAAANSLIEGYCDDFVSLAASLAQTLEQIAMRRIDIAPSRQALERIEQGMRNLGEAIHDLLSRDAPSQARPALKPASAPARSEPRAAADPSKPRPAAGSAKVRTNVGALKGTSQSMPLLSVFQFLGRTRKEGTIEIRLDDARVTFWLQQGCIIDSRAEPCPIDERLPDLLLELGVVAGADLKQLRTDGVADDRALAHAVVDAGLASAEDVAEALAEQISRRYARACRHRQAEYEFSEGSVAIRPDGLQRPFAIR